MSELVLVSVIVISFIVIAFMLFLLQKNNKEKAQMNETIHVQDIELRTLQVKLEQVKKLETTLDHKNSQIDRIQKEIASKDEKLAELRTLNAQQEKNMQEKIDLLQKAKAELAQQFKEIADKIFEEKQNHFMEKQQHKIDTIFVPLKEQIKDFKKKVEDVAEKDGKDRLTLLHQIEDLKKLNIQMSEEATNLTKALKGDKKAQGNWGEMILESVLQASGLQKGREYETQVTYKNEQGKRLLPDVVIHLPENKDLVVDSKVSLIDYEKYCSATTDNEKQEYLRAHILAIRNHIKSLSEKRYADLPELHTLDFIFLFVAVEPAYLLAVQNDASLFTEAFERKIIIVSPTTLLATLKVVQNIWRYEKQNKNAEEIARQAGALHDKFVDFVTELEKVGSLLDRAQEAYVTTHKRLVSGKGDLIGRTQRLEQLGAKAQKAIPAHLLQNDNEALE